MSNEITLRRGTLLYWLECAARVGSLDRTASPTAIAAMLLAKIEDDPSWAAAPLVGLSSVIAGSITATSTVPLVAAPIQNSVPGPLDK